MKLLLHTACTSLPSVSVCGLFYMVCYFFDTEPKPVYAQPGQPDVDLPVSPSDAPVPSAVHDESILR